MAKWDFKIVGASFVKELVPIADDVQPRSQSFMQPSFHLEGGKIVMKESGQYVTAIYFPQIGEIGGVAPTDIDDAYAKLLTLVENFNGGGVTPQTLAETLAEDNKTNDIPIESNTASGYLYVNDEQTILGNDVGGTKRITITEDAFAIETNVRATIDGKGLQLGTTTDGFGLPILTTTQMNAIVVPTEGMLIRNTTEGKIYQFNGTVWEVLTPSIPFEIQVTQASTSAPTIVSGSENGLRGATLTTNYISDGDYTIVADLPIFADAKDCYKGVNNIPFNLIIEWDNAWLYAWFWYISDDYTIKVRTSENPTTSILADGILTDPVLIKIEYKN